MSLDKNRLSADEITRKSKEYTFFSWAAQSEVNPIPIERAEGVYFWDAEGKRYIDFSAQLMNVNIGHQHPKVIHAIKEQADRLCYAHPGLATEPRGRLGELLAEVTPGNLRKTFFCLGGAEANENAIKMARLYTGRRKILAHYISYHGATHGAIALTGDNRRWSVEPTMPGVVHVLNPYCYRCPFGWTRETCHRECIDHIEEVIQYEGPEDIAAIFFEGVVGSNGIIVPPDDYWPRMREICDKYGILLISDEVMSGFGRTGKWFAVDNWDVAPDIITLAKGVTSGYVPLGAVVVSERIAQHFEDNKLWCGLTYSGHPLSCAAGVATVKVYEEDGLIDNAAEVGTHLGARLEELKSNHPSVGDVRYIGLFSVIEVVKDKETKEPMATRNAEGVELKTMNEIGAYLREHGLFTFIKANMIFIVPPLCITKGQIDEGFQIIDNALSISDQATF
ncbi:MAG: aminotransferase class III-fold pyridoxal phosphate-dependent enzyme [Anaerolineales bacterium]|nr:aminotransferase class III-fold pyridoxal phosphate-dependent enzyme [Anaerolineales bacterium]